MHTLKPTQKVVILVNGVPAAGKSSVSGALAETLGWPLLSLDAIKNPFLQRLNDVDRDFNRLLGAASYQAIWSVVASAPRGNGFIIDAWFGFQPKADLENYLAQAGVTDVLEVWCPITPELAAQRYAARLDQRLPGHPGAAYIPELKALAEKAQPMSLGEVYIQEQQQTLEITALTAWVRNSIK